MARIKGVSSAQAGPYVKLASHFTRRGIGKLTGRETERMIEPLEMYAHVPVLFKGYAKLEQATSKLHHLDRRLHALAELKAATLTHCEYCIDMGSAISRRWGLTDEEVLALSNYQTSPLFSELALNSYSN
jgi:AhpD family alkylhydroperoxidase